MKLFGEILDLICCLCFMGRWIVAGWSIWFVISCQLSSGVVCELPMP